MPDAVAVLEVLKTVCTKEASAGAATAAFTEEEVTEWFVERKAAINRAKRKMAAEVLGALKEPLLQDDQIANYLERNPVKPSTGPLGVPQDKYHWGFYGHQSMDYDSWGRLRKDKKK